MPHKIRWTNLLYLFSVKCNGILIVIVHTGRDLYVLKIYLLEPKPLEAIEEYFSSNPHGLTIAIDDCDSSIAILLSAQTHRCCVDKYDSIVPTGSEHPLISSEARINNVSFKRFEDNDKLHMIWKSPLACAEHDKF